MACSACSACRRSVLRATSAGSSPCGCPCPAPAAAARAAGVQLVGLQAGALLLPQRASACGCSPGWG